MKNGKYEIGDIVFVSKYKYENGKDGNNHLFVIISDDLSLSPRQSIRYLNAADWICNVAIGITNITSVEMRSYVPYSFFVK